MPIKFETERLKITELPATIPKEIVEALVLRIPHVLTAPVVNNLPPYFHGINDQNQASKWLERMLLDSRLLQVNTFSNELIGFIFIHENNDATAHIGYLLAESHWGKGLATELLKGLINAVHMSEPWEILIAGVDTSNLASINLLKKVGFTEQKSNTPLNVFFNYRFLD